VKVALREFALAVYGADGVSPACLLLQDRWGLDVNLLLFAGYVGAAREQTLTPAALDTAAAHVEAWHRDVVRPLRAVRQRLKSGPAPAPNPATAELRERVKRLEIQAELIELDELDRLALPLDAASGDARDRARAALEVVLRAHTGRQPDTAESAALTTIAVAAANETRRIA
jgi:uncharacterized protein (TIGR02444 family)